MKMKQNSLVLNLLGTGFKIAIPYTMVQYGGVDFIIGNVRFTTTTDTSYNKVCVALDPIPESWLIDISAIEDLSED